MSRRSSLFALLALASPLLAADAPAPAPAPETPSAQAIARLQPLLKTRPQDPTLYFYLAMYHARDGMAEPACVALRKMQEFGAGLLPARYIGFEKIEKDEGYRRVYADLEAALPKVVDGTVAFRLADKKFIPEGIAWDAKGKRFFVGSIPQKRIVQVTPAGKMTPFSQDSDDLDFILGLAVDAAKGRLVAVSTTAMTEAGKAAGKRRNRLVSYDLASGKKAADVALPEADQLNDVIVAPDGLLYASDSGGGTVWKVSPDGTVGILGEKAMLRSVNGLATSADGKLLYVAHATGIVIAELPAGELSRLAPPPRETIAAIDGLYFHEGALIGIQNATNPGRVIRMVLSPDGRRMTAVETLQSHHHPAFDEPTTAAIADGALYVLATTQVAKFNEKGEIEKPEGLKEPAVVKIALPK